MANKNIKKKPEEIEIPFPDRPRNIVVELHFDDEPTRLRCRGWLVVPAKTFLKANIIFPGSDIDCRLSLQARSGRIVLRAVFNNSRVCLGARFTTMLYLVHEYVTPWIRSG